MNVHKNEADDTESSGANPTTTTYSDLDSTLDDIFAKLAGSGSTGSISHDNATPVDDHHWHSDDATFFTDELHEAQPVADASHSNDSEWQEEEDDTAPVTHSSDKHWHSDDNTYFTDELGDGATTQTDDTASHSNAAEWHEDDASVADTDAAASEPSGPASTAGKFWHTDDANYFTDEVQGDQAQTSSSSAPHDNSAEWHEDVAEGWNGDGVAHVDEAPADDSPDRWFTDVNNEENHANEAIEEPASVEHADDTAKWFTDVHNEENHANEAVEEPVATEHADDSAKWFTDVHNEENHANEAIEEPASTEHADDSAKWFTDVHNEENHVNEDIEGLVDNLSNTHADDASPDARWFTDVHNEENHVNEAVEVPAAAEEHVDDTDKWFTDEHQ